MSSTGTSLLGEADLHGLVDGDIAPERRIEALRRLAVSPSDRARVESWQGQNDLLRSTFTGIAREPLPPMLDLKAKPQLQCVPANDARIIELPRAAAKETRRPRKFGTAFGAIAVIAAGLGGSWVLLNQVQPEAARPGPQLRGPIDVALVGRSSDAIKKAPAAAASVPRQATESLPTTDIPDLRTAGFSFAGAETSASRPISIVFRYQNGKAERVAVTVAARDPAEQKTSDAPVAIGGAYSWRKGNKAYALAGTLNPAKLHALALTLQQDDTQ